MTLPSLVWKMAVAILSLSLSVLAQTPTQTWTPAASCTNGLATPASSSGSYIDAFGANYAVQCGQDSTGPWYDGNAGTNGHGIYSCFLGCDNRPGCTAFMYTGTVTGKYAPGSALYFTDLVIRCEYWVWQVLLQVYCRDVLQQFHCLRQWEFA